MSDDRLFFVKSVSIPEPKDGTVDLCIAFNPMNPDSFQIKVDDLMEYMDDIGSGTILKQRDQLREALEESAMKLESSGLDGIVLDKAIAALKATEEG